MADIDIYYIYKIILSIKGMDYFIFTLEMDYFIKLILIN